MLFLSGVNTQCSYHFLSCCIRIITMTFITKIIIVVITKSAKSSRNFESFVEEILVVLIFQKPKMKSQYVRVGGGWMKIDHYRNHHIPLKIFEHDRTAKEAKKFLSIKYRYTKDRKKTPIAWSKYRSTIAKDS